MEAHWDWCHACGFDPEGKKAAAEAAEAAAAAPAPPPFPGAGAPAAPLGAAFPGAPAPGAPGAPPAPSFGGATPPPGSSPRRGFSTAFDDDDDLPGFGGDDDFDDDPARGFPPSSNEPAENHPYEGLPYSQDAAPAPTGGLPSVPPPAPTGGPGAPGGFTPMGAGGTGFSGGGGPAAPGSYSPPGFGPGTSGYVGASGRTEPSTGGPGAGFQPGGGFSSGGGAPGGPGGYTGPGGPGAYTGPAQLGAGAKPNQSKLMLIGGIGVLVVVLLGVGVVMFSGKTETGSGPTTTRDPNAPKPLGEVVPGKQGGGSSVPSTNGGGSPNVSHPNATGGWVTYHSPDGSFQVDFPGAVRTTSKQVPINGQQQVQLDVIYEVGTEGGGFDAGYVDLETASMFADSQAAFDKLNEAGLAMTAIGPFTIDGKAGVHYTRDSRGKQEKGVLLVSGRRLYNMAVLDVNDEDFSKFVYSFHITG